MKTRSQSLAASQEHSANEDEPPPQLDPESGPPEASHQEPNRDETTSPVVAQSPSKSALRAKKRKNATIIKLSKADCVHEPRESDLHHRRYGCEGCRKAAGIPLCDENQCCRHCYELPELDFAMMLQDRERNAHRALLRRQRKERERAQSVSSNNRKRKLQQAIQEQHEIIHKRSAPPPAQFLNSLQLTPPTSKRELAHIVSMNPIEKASYDDLRQWMVDIPQFVLTHRLHPWVAMHVASTPALQMVPLCDVSAQLDAQYPNVRSMTAQADSHARRSQPTASYQPVPPPAPAPAPAPTRDFLADDYVDVADSDDDDFVDQRSHYSRADTATPADFMTIDQAVDTSATDPDIDPAFSEILTLVADSVEDVQALAPPAASTRRQPRSASNKREPPKVRLGLTTATLIKDTVALREEEFTDQVRMHKSRDLGRITGTKDLFVKLASYLPGDTFWPVKPPTVSPDFPNWLPIPHKNSSVVLSMADTENLETTARALVLNNSSMDSAYAALLHHSAPLDEKSTAAALSRWIGNMIRDNAKMSTYLALSLQMLRRDWVLSASSLNTAEKNRLRTSPQHGCDQLFDPILSAEIVEGARKRATDSHMTRGFG